MTIIRRAIGGGLFLSLLVGAPAIGQDAKVAKPAAGPPTFRLHLASGSVVVGEPTIAKIVVETDYGTLNVPIDRLRSLTPGLNSRPRLSEKIRSLVEKLGSAEYQTRQLAHRDIVKMGLPVRSELARFQNVPDPERKRHVQQILEEFVQLEADLEAERDEDIGDQADKQDDDLGDSSRTWKRTDTVVTDDSTFSGKISLAKITLRSKYGAMTIALADVVRADRVNVAANVVNKWIVVTGKNLVQRSFKTSKIDVRRGDRITIKVDGQIRMSSWTRGDYHPNTILITPDGSEAQGWYVKDHIRVGALIAKIGSSGKEFQVGGKYDFVAERSGTLQFAVAMQDPYSVSGFHFPGHYNVRIKVVPK